MNQYHSTKAKPYVYCCRHRITGQYYIGYRERNALLGIPSTIDLMQYKTSSKIVKPFFDEYESIVLAEFESGDAAYDFEQELIFENWADTLLINKNCQINGKRFKKNYCSEKTKAKISAKNKGRKLSQEHKLIISQLLKGRKKSEETKQRMRKPKSQEHANNIRLGRLGKKLSDSTKQKQSLGKLNMPLEKRKKWIDSMSRARKGIVTAYDLELKQVVKIPKTDFDQLKNIKYVGLNSKLRNQHGEFCPRYL
jgi:hypothetical protein